MHNAAMKGHTELLRFLAMQNECDFSIVNKNHRTVLHCACQEGNLDMIRLLIDRNSQICAKQDKEGTTPFQIAAFSGHFQIVKFLASLPDVNPNIPCLLYTSDAADE